jgi:hypothetical protein
VQFLPPVSEADGFHMGKRELEMWEFFIYVFIFNFEKNGNVGIFHPICEKNCEAYFFYAIGQTKKALIFTFVTKTE